MSKNEDEPSESAPAKELTVCDIMGEWGAYQWSVTLFATLYSAILSMTIVVGPLWTPDMRHICAPSDLNQTESPTSVDFSGDPHECYATKTYQSSLVDFSEANECTNFLYDDSQHGQMLTNVFDLVCSRTMLKSAVSSSALFGMLLSSVSLGLLSDKYGRISCLKTGFTISIVSTFLAIFAHNYLLFNVAILLMSYAQVGVGNALCTLVMESTSPRWRFVPVFEYGIGWGLGMMICPFLNDLTKNYRYFLLISLVWQLLMLIWYKYGVFESIRWLLSEGLINQAQIELRRACRFNRVKNGAELAQKIADVQINQLRKASCVIEEKMAPMRLAKALHADEETASQELSVLSSAIRKSFALDSPLNGTTLNVDSNNGQQQNNEQQQLVELMIMGDCGPQHRNSITTQGLIQLALKYSKTLQQQEEGKFFLMQMFHRKLYKITLTLMLLSLTLETSYYGLLQANKFVGSSINVNYITGAASEWLAAVAYMAIMGAFNRRVALMGPTTMGSIACLCIALTYQLIPNVNTRENAAAGFTGAGLDFKTISFGLYAGNSSSPTQEDMVQYRDNINFWVMNVGKLAITAAIQVSATIVMEAYPNNLRQSGSGAIVMVGRIGSIVAPFLFNDLSEDKFVLKMTLITIACMGFFTSSLVPFLVRDTTGKELCDRLNEIDD